MLPKFDAKLNSDLTMSVNEMGWQHLGAELVFTQDIDGNYLSFWWAKAAEYGLDTDCLTTATTTDSTDGANIFAPVDSFAYLEKVRRVIKRRLPEQCYCLFQCNRASCSFELVISPILPTNGEPQAVLVIGHLLDEVEMFSFDKDEEIGRASCRER